jgi:hypothetical protein
MAKRVLSKEQKRERLVKLLLKRGNNQESVDSMIQANFDYVVSTYPDSTPSKLAEIIICL